MSRLEDGYHEQQFRYFKKDSSLVKTGFSAFMCLGGLSITGRSEDGLLGEDRAAKIGDPRVLRDFPAYGEHNLFVRDPGAVLFHGVMHQPVSKTKKDRFWSVPTDRELPKAAPEPRWRGSLNSDTSRTNGTLFFRKARRQLKLPSEMISALGEEEQRKAKRRDAHSICSRD